MDQELKREILLDNYSNPFHKETKDGFLKANANNISCIDDINVFIKIEDNINKLAKNPKANDYLLPSGSTKLAIKEATTGLSAMVTFIGLYLGVIFLISSAAILGLKELSESSDNKQKCSKILIKLDLLHL